MQFVTCHTTICLLVYYQFEYTHVEVSEVTEARFYALSDYGMQGGTRTECCPHPREGRGG